MKSQLQYIMAGAGITLLVILGTLTLLLPRAQAGVVSENNSSEIITAIESVQSGSSDILPSVSQNEPEQAANASTEAELASLAAAESPTEAPAEAFLAAMGTKDNPQTNMDIIVYTVSELARKQEEILMGKPGWLHVKTQLSIPEEQRGNGYHSATTDEIIPMEVLVPNDPILESWYHVDENGLYQEALSLVTTPDGTIYQQSVLVDGAWVNLTLKTLGTHPNQYETPTISVAATSPATNAFQTLEKSRTWSNVSMQAYLENGQYIVIKEQNHDPIEGESSIPEPVIKSKEIYVFDQVTGQLISSKTQALLQSGTWITVGEKSYLMSEFLPELPMETSKLFSDSMIMAGENK